MSRRTITLTETSPAAASTVVGSTFLGGLAEADYLTMDATLTGATGGTLDIYLQREIGLPGSDVWADWYRFAQLSAGASAAHYTLSSDAKATTITAIGIGTATAEGDLTLAAGTLTTPIPCGRVRFVFVAGTSTSAGAAQTVRFTLYKQDRHL